MNQDGFSPLAAKLRPRVLAEIIGQSHLLTNGSVLFSLAHPAEASAPSQSIVLWGPPGAGKTTIALAVARESGRNFIELSAVSAGVKEIRDAISEATSQRETYGRGSLLFIDEIHRFSKSQQDALLPAVENGTFVLIGATTENPSFAINNALLSRCVILELQPLQADELHAVLNRALASPDGFDGEVPATDEALAAIVRLSAGDARRALVILESAASVCKARSDLELSEKHVFEVSNTAALHYDRNSDIHYDVISAFIKSIRGSDADAAIHYLARMLESGEDPRFIARRLMISAAEDIGLADPDALVLTTAAAQSVALIGMPEARIALAEVTIYLALAPKSNSSYNAINAAIADVRSGIVQPVPVHLRNTHPGGKKAAKYLYPHDSPAGVVEQEYLPPQTKARNYYLAKTFGFEAGLSTRWEALKKIIRGR